MLALVVVAMDRISCKETFQISIWKVLTCIFLIGITTVNFSSAQKDISGKVVYDVYEGNYTNEVPGSIGALGVNKVNLDDDFAPKSILLEFKNDASFCSLAEESTISNNNWSKYKEISLEITGEIFYDFSKKEFLNSHHEFDKLYLISKNIEAVKWSLKDETKEILGYVCKKAVREIKYTQVTGKSFMIKYVAWYAPDINVPFGPYGHINLPGLILEIDKTGGHTEFQYKARDIELNGSVPIQIVKPNKGIPISQKEFDKKLEDRVKEIMGMK
ncbi:GLPGLI family protein [Maribacter sp. 2304DJ31-5]|uniref:GLPGLI family protein n=1 Tax=Maribacter sp. 2304DJ31-5 TaxID=3386273 RepID=UPI0039BC95A8